jgi:hypothetical protein
VRWGLFAGGSALSERNGVWRTLVASASLDGDDLTLVPNYPGITGVKLASPRGFEPRFSP